VMLLQEIYRIKDFKNAYKILGVYDKNIEIIKSYFDCKIVVKDNIIKSNAKEEIKEILEDVFYKMDVLSSKTILNEREVIYLIKLREAHKLNGVVDFFTLRKPILTKWDGKNVYPKTFTQEEYIKTIEKEEIIFGVGPAGTGKTYLAVAMAVSYLKQNKVKKLILTRPAVEAGEYLGFLPGDLKEKIDPYLRPLYDALYDFLGVETTNKLLETKVIEIAPLAYMRGKTLENAFIILDEAQNTSAIQMKMFLTRLGFSSKMVITGDPSQTDLQQGRTSGLKQAISILKNIHNIKTIEFMRLDVVRNPLVQKILERYDEHGNL